MIHQMLPAIEEELRQAVALASKPGLEEMDYMLRYHMGWEGEGAGPEARGKRIRPCLVLLTASSAGADWHMALPAAAAVELLHNFSLIHDDIQDQSPVRRGRLTVWKRWGAPQAINTGDAMFTLAYLALLRLEETISVEVALQAGLILQQTSLALTQGQHLDIAYESRCDIKLDDYWPMVRGKTAALIAACTELGALVAQVSGTLRATYHRFGENLGLAFQAQDDLLGIWGDAAITGKSAESDLLAGKKSLPVLFGLSAKGPFAKRWSQGPVTPDEVPGLAAQLETEGARAYTQEQADRLTDAALKELEDASPAGAAGEELSTLARRLLRRIA